MHLKQLKLAGFKSFVEPTIIPIPSQLVAVVGPNGCGKSNIIDAVRWVMGESSAKNLRGESMTDVIFNGSSSRKPLGQASVELIFDNSLGRLSGEYGCYQEVAVKRLVTRDGESHYYLNNARCRRRDVHDIFLGTGAGARGYAIIGQDMISRLIEARPEELRAYLEEAAGVSKYKERRRETLQRIEQTRENLDRVADIREELAKQLTRLEQQAENAERYKTLKTKERRYKTEILACKWQHFKEERSQIRNEIKQASSQHESLQMQIRDVQKEEALLQEQIRKEQDVLQKTQAEYYQLGREIARLEEQIQQKVLESQRLLADKRQMQEDHQAIAIQLDQDKQSLQESERELSHLRLECTHLQAAYQQKQQKHQHQQKEKAQWDKHWQAIETTRVQVKHEAEVANIRLQDLTQRRQQTLSRLEKIQQGKASISIQSQQQELEQLHIKCQALKDAQAIAIAKHRQAQNELACLQQETTNTEYKLNRDQDEVQALTTEIAALQAALDAALSHSNDDADTDYLHENKRLIDEISVNEAWLPVIEWILADSLHAVLLESLEPIWPSLSGWQGQGRVFVRPAPKTQMDKVYPRLVDQISGTTPSWFHNLDFIYAADCLDEALSWLTTLNTQESVVTKDGYWLGHGWVKIAPLGKQNESVLARKQALIKQKASLSEAHEQLNAQRASRDELHQSIAKAKNHAEQLKRQVDDNQDALRACESAITSARKSLEQDETREQALAEEIDELMLHCERFDTQTHELESRFKKSQEQLAQYQEKQAVYIEEKAAWDIALNQLQRGVDEARTNLHQMELSVEREQLKVEQFKTNLKRDESHIETLGKRLQQLEQRYDGLQQPNDELKTILEEKVNAYEQLEKTLMNQKKHIQDLEAKAHECGHQRTVQQKQSESLNDAIQKQRMQEQAIAIKTQGVLDDLNEFNVDMDVLMANMAEDASQAECEMALARVSKQIKALGAVNLVAIEEYQNEKQRKQHLDEQYDDLICALQTLEKAISKMDNETRERLQDTFDAINSSFQSLFPRLFGGGRAKLELTCDNLLEAGILVMAQPPGKRNTRIQMLSGGEKAMTAVALVFAFFQLNPAPFCMLDEVDAPLDDANIRRFCELVEEMSKVIQFLFITHNKVTMELADHLVGVTMREPGVSRTVAVDVKQALSIAQ